MSIPIPSYGFGVLLLLCCFGVSLSTSQNNGFSVELIHRDSSRSPLYNPTETKFQRISNSVHHSINRAKYVNQMFYASSHTNTLVSNLTPYLGVGHIMSYSIGSPPFQMYGYLDLLIDMIWFQCKPCNPCLNLTSPIFDPSKSSTYTNIPCDHSKCYYLRYAKCISDNCKYHLVKNSSYSQGDLSADTFTLNSTTGSPISFPEIVIGCEHKNAGGFPLEGKVSGMIGLGGGPLSLTSQLDYSIGGKFSYCLVPFFSNSNTSSTLNFGDAAVVSGPQIVSTPIKQIDPIAVTLQAFSVGNKTILLEQPAFAPITRRNTIIDIGTSITVLPMKVYSKLESAVVDLIKLQRVNDPSHDQLNLCYQSTIEELEIPIITAHFLGADLQLKPLNTFMQIDDKVVCFAFTSYEYFGGAVIFGNIAQNNFLVGYDFQKKIVSFKPADCTNQ
ncbi:unnamed protein product [Trifolium pratense]|uniref:Uncharacterized protein n=1 Tax=Trifolium pratense TaxID=57577 RepID=A0ACB0LPL5_TRIPR|nr:unnamed protein product [Trifolium pratense]